MNKSINFIINQHQYLLFDCKGVENVCCDQSSLKFIDTNLNRKIEIDFTTIELLLETLHGSSIKRALKNAFLIPESIPDLLEALYDIKSPEDPILDYYIGSNSHHKHAKKYEYWIYNKNGEIILQINKATPTGRNFRKNSKVIQNYLYNNPKILITIPKYRLKQWAKQIQETYTNVKSKQIC